MKKDKPTFSETVPIKLKELGYIPPIIKSYDKDGMCVRLKKTSKGEEFWVLMLNDVQWMSLEPGHSSACQVYSHYKLAKGHVICTGLGFGIREQWIASKPEVTKVTVLEKFKEVIDYHKDIGTKWHDKIEIINCDATDYKGSCDFLSIDHYEFDDVLRIIDSVRKVYRNITCECVWFWMLEPWIKEGYCVLQDHIIDNTGNPATIRKTIRYGGKENDILENYSKIKKYFDIDKLPSLEESELIKFIIMFHEGIDEYF